MARFRSRGRRSFSKRSFKTRGRRGNRRVSTGRRLRVGYRM